MSSQLTTRDRTDEYLRATFVQLKAMGGRGRPQDIFDAIKPGLNLTASELDQVKTGGIRWETALRWYTVDCVKAGYLRKLNGYWELTPEGEKALSLPPGELIRSANQKYREWKRSQKGDTPVDNETGESEETVSRQTQYEQAIENAQNEIEKYINDLGPYDFQNLVAELLSGMGYHISFVAPPGPDGGLDIVAYKDPLGTTPPRIKVQVKHREQKVSVKEVRELQGILSDSDIGLIVSSEGFTTEAEKEIRRSSRHIETMDRVRVIDLWEKHYDNISERGKKLLPLVKIFFLAPVEE
jgi:restriction system protein